jgi:hypothetical protein
MLNSKILFPYIFGLLSLIVSLGIVYQGKLVAEQLPSPTPSATPLPKPEPFPGAARLARCRALSQPRFFFYVLPILTEAGKDLVISGTIYTSDLHPLSNVLVEVSSADFDQVNSAYPPPFYRRIRTDKDGRYEVAIMDATWPDWSYLHYRVTYQDSCPLLMHLHLGVEPLPRPSKPVYAQVEVTGPVLQGPIDIVLPVLPLP